MYNIEYIKYMIVICIYVNVLFMIGSIQFARFPIPRMYIAVTSLSLFYKYTATIARTEVERNSLNMYYICYRIICTRAI